MSKVVTAVLIARVKLNKLQNNDFSYIYWKLRSQGKPQLRNWRKEVGTESHNLPGTPKWNLLLESLSVKAIKLQLIKYWRLRR